MQIFERKVLDIQSSYWTKTLRISLTFSKQIEKLHQRLWKRLRFSSKIKLLKIVSYQVSRRNTSLLSLWCKKILKNFKLTVIIENFSRILLENWRCLQVEVDHKHLSLLKTEISQWEVKTMRMNYQVMDKKTVHRDKNSQSLESRLDHKELSWKKQWDRHWLMLL